MISLSIDSFVIIALIMAITFCFVIIKFIQYLENKNIQAKKFQDDNH